MATATTEGIRVSVETFYQQGESQPLLGSYLFAYRITITNLGQYPVKLLRRHWHIVDSIGTHREVEGEGVVGQQPIVAPGESYTYVSGCSLQTEMGAMYGTYTFQNKYNHRLFEAKIPRFDLLAPQKLN